MSNIFKPVDTTLPVEQTFWTRCKAFWLQDANEWLSQDADVVLDNVCKKIHDFFCREVTFGTKNTDAE